MSVLRRLFGPTHEPPPPEPVVSEEGHVHTPDAHPDDVVLPKQKRSSRSLLAGKPPRGWKRQASEASGGLWPWGGGENPAGHGFGGGGGDFGGGDSGGGGGGDGS